MPRGEAASPLANGGDGRAGSKSRRSHGPGDAARPAISIMTSVATAETIQREYYRRTANKYDDWHRHGADAHHDFALSFLSSAIRYLGVKSVLDIGSGTGRGLLSLKAQHPGVRIIGVEPSRDLREIGHQNGLTQDELIDGDALALGYPDSTFDFVIETGALHHIPNARKAVSEMLRVASRGVFISDCNSYGQGSPAARAMKQFLRAVRLWKVYDFIRTRGTGYMITEGDGVFYSYSVYDDYPLIRRACRSVHVLNTSDAGVNPFRSAAQVALIGLK